jgi:membrane protease subunit (stomatin/prohibitin family)
MGLFDSITGESKRNFIARPDEAKSQIIWKYPEKNIRMMTQLTVMPDEVALFIKDGRLEGRLGPGAHQLDAKSIPFLGALVEKFTGGNLYIAEVFFITTRDIAGMKFGGPMGSLVDPETGFQLDTMVYGSMTMRVEDPLKLVMGLVGTGKSTNEDFLGWYRNQVLKVMKDRVGEQIVKKKWPVSDVISGHYTEELEQEIVAAVKPHTDTYGLRIVGLENFQISIKEEDAETLKKFRKDMAYSRAAGGFQQYAQAQAMLGAAEGMAKGGGGADGAMAGMGMGMGMGMAGMFANQQAQQRAPAAPSPAAPAAGQVFCSSCGTPGTGKFCAQCGNALAGPRKCAGCQGDLQAGAKFCPSCGKPA